MSLYVSIKHCNTCFYYNKKYNECHRYPPVFCPPYHDYSTSTSKEHLFHFFPKVNGTFDWCGEHKEK